MGEAQLVQELMLTFARQRISSAAKIVRMQDQKLAGIWVAWVESGVHDTKKLVARQKNNKWEVQLYSGLMDAIEHRERRVEAARRGGSPDPSERNARWHLDRRYETGEIGYEEYMRRLRLIGQR